MILTARIILTTIMTIPAWLLYFGEGEYQKVGGYLFGLMIVCVIQITIGTLFDMFKVINEIKEKLK